MKTYLLDTTILLYNADSIFAFENNNVIIPLSVIEEIEKFKKDVNEIGKNARKVSEYLDELRKLGSLISGVKLNNGGKLFVATPSKESIKNLNYIFSKQSKNFKILATALTVKSKNDTPVILVTKDIYLRIKADALNILAQDYEYNKVDIEELYSGTAVIKVDTQIIDEFEKYGTVEYENTLSPNQYITLVDCNDNNRIALGKFDTSKKSTITKLITGGSASGWRIDSRNIEQSFALDALLDDSIQLVTLIGSAGTGKTLLAIASGIYKTVDEDVYNRILVSRPTMALGQDIGYLPGTVEEKLTPWMYPIVDNVELIMRKEKNLKGQSKNFSDLVEMGILVIEPLTYIRGRSIQKQFLIVDEAQNLTPHEIKTIVTRVGDGTKIVLTGDPCQIDNPYVDSSSNGLTYLVEKFKNERISAHISLQKCERSELSELAAKLL